jgi:hypothetical protein
MALQKFLNGNVAASLIVSCVLSACAGQSGNQKLAETQTSELNKILIKGKTNKQGVIDIFGEPNDTDIMDNGREKWIYSHLRKDAKVTNFIPVANWFASGTDDTTKKLVIIFRDGMVENFSTSTSFGETQAGLFN